MSMISLAHCLLGHHQPVRRHVHWEEKCLVGECRHCGKPIHRVRQGDWRAGGA